MIAITRLDGSTLVVNADLIETIEHHGDTVVTLVSGARFVARESVAEIIDAVVGFRTTLLQAAEEWPADRASSPSSAVAGPAGAGKVIPMTPKSRSGEGE